jgi:hypothetical protein
MYRGLHIGLIGLLGMFLSSASYAGPIVINQPQANDAIQINAFAPVGQSFTASSSSIETIELALRNFNLPGNELDHTVTVTLFGGEGFVGPQLSQSTVDVDAILGTDPVGVFWWISFGMGNIPLVIGDAYSFLVFDSTPRFGLNYNLGDVYAGGHAYNADLGFGTYGDVVNNDLAFRVTTTATALPEPVSLSIFLLGILLLAWVRAGRMVRCRVRFRGVVSSRQPVDPSS